MAKLTFLGAAGSVTGSKYLVKTAGKCNGLNGMICYR
jgi:hypothetical protein